MPKGIKLAPEQRMMMVEMRQNGRKIHEIAQEFGVGTSTVNREKRRIEEERAGRIKIIDDELANIRATLRNALEIAESGDVPN